MTETVLQPDPRPLDTYQIDGCVRATLIRRQAFRTLAAVHFFHPRVSDSGRVESLVPRGSFARSSSSIVRFVSDRLDLLILGDANPDLVLTGNVEPMFGQAERLVDEARLTVGGSGAIVACAAARLGLRVGLCGVVGDDLFGRFTSSSAGGSSWKRSSSNPMEPPGLRWSSRAQTIARS